MKRYSVVLLLLIIIFSLTGCSNETKSTPTSLTRPKATTPASTLPSNPAGRILTVSFINVGQGDSILFQLPNQQTMLIDAGSNEAGPTVVSYLKNRGINKIDYLIGTHPHEDHIGGMDNVIQNFDIGIIYMPKITATTESFADVVNAVKSKGLKISTGKSEMTIIDQDNLKVGFIAPDGNKYEELNNWSIVTKVQYGKNSFLLTGDAQDLSEQKMLEAGDNLQAEVLKIGHHGSHSSTIPAFLKAVNPQYTVISVGEGNDYGHPHAVTLRNLHAAGVNIYRTDINGTIVFNSNGQTLTVTQGNSQGNVTSPATSLSDSTLNVNTPIAPVKYIGNSKSKKYHLPDCSGLPAPQNQIIFTAREDATAQGFTPCGLCNP